LSPVANNMVKTYSGGMVRRLELACALIIKPRILFLDEPTIGLDPSARSVVWKELTSFKKDYGITIFFNTHYMDEADHYTDEIAIINKGQIIKRGTADELKHSIGGEVIEVTTAGLEPNPAILDRIRALTSVMSVSVENSEIRITVHNAETALPGIMDALRQSNIPAKKIAMTKPTLDDVFLKYAGTRLDVGGRISDVTHMRTMIKKG
jgi:ABC-2 type transport system ATP-binding protein